MVDMPHATSAAAAIREHARLTPERPALIFVNDVERDDGATEWSYAQLDAGARMIGSWLRARFSAGDRALLLYPSGFDFVVAFVGCLYAGIVAVPAPLPGRYHHERQRLQRIATEVAATVILTDSENLPAVKEWATAEDLTSVLVLATDTEDVTGGGSLPLGELSRETLALIQYTSGSTGDPKGVMVSHGNILHNAGCQHRAWGLPADARIGGWLPLYHDMGLLGLALPTLLLGSTCVLMHPVAFLKQPYRWLRMMDKYDVNGTAAPNFAYELCCARVTDEQLADLDLSRLRLAANGSEPVSAETLAAFVKRFAAAGLRDDALSPCYGMAESTLFVSIARNRRGLVTTVDSGRLERHQFVPAASGTDLVSCGTPRDYDVLITDPQTGKPLPPGYIGEIWLRGPSVSSGYWGDDAATARALSADGYLHTGDVGTLHDGELYLTGRLEEIVTVHGRHLYPQDIERGLRARHAELTGAGAAFTVPLDHALKERALVITHEVSGRLAEDRLRQLAAEIRRTVAREFGVHLGGISLLRRGTVRRTTSGKIQRAAMRQLFLKGGLNTVYAEHGPQVADALRLRQLTPAGM